MADNCLSIKAGKIALAEISRNGLNQNNIKVIAGAAGGPKWLILSGLDHALFTSFFSDRKRILYTIGSSIAAWRFSAAMQKDPGLAISKFENAYINQKYKSDNPSSEEVSAESFRIFDEYISPESIEYILNHPYMRINFLSIRCKPLLASDNKNLLFPGLLATAFANILNRKFLKFFMERTLFYDKRDIPPFFNMEEFPIQKTFLSKENFRSAIMSSGSIPLVMSGVKNRKGEISGAEIGTYRDGGLIDYHLDIPFIPEGEGLVLYPHFHDKIIPGWFDKHLSWRKPSPKNMERVILISPSKSFLDKLPFRKIPDRNDFKLFKGRNSERIKYWKTVVSENRRLADEFLEVVSSDKIMTRVTPL